MITDQEIATNCACFKLRSAARAVTRAYDKAFQPLGIKATQFTLLNAIGMTAPISISVLAEKLSMDRTTLTRNLRPLEKHGWITSVAGHGRSVELSLTEPGRALLEAGKPRWSEAQANLVATLPAATWATLKKTLDEIATHA